MMKPTTIGVQLIPTLILPPNSADGGQPTADISITTKSNDPMTTGDQTVDGG